MDLRSHAADLLDEVAPADVEGFYSYRIAETVLRLGGPAALSPERSRTALAAARSPRLLRSVLRPERRLRTNFLVVAARCLWALAGLEGRQPPELPELLRRVADLFAASATGWINDGLDPWMQYDIYSPDMYLLAEPFAERLGPGWSAGFARVIDDLEVLAQPPGAVVWGRSVGALSLAMTIEVGAVCAQHSLGRSPGPWLARAWEALGQLDSWFADGVITAHQGRASDPYRGSHRRLQMTLDVYGKLLIAARSLRLCPAQVAPCDPSAAWPMADTLVAFDDCARSAAWAYRSRSLSFVLPIMHGYSPDYLPSPRWPGVFEQPTAGPPVMIPAVVSRAAADGQATLVPLVPAGAGRIVGHEDNALTLEFDGWAPVGADAGDPRTRQGGRLASYRVRGRTLEVHERLNVEGACGSVVLLVGDSPDQPVRLSAEPEGASLDINTAGMAEWHSHWGASSRVQQVEFGCDGMLEFTWRVTRGLRIASSDASHQYSRALYGPMTGQAAVIPAGDPDAGLTGRLRETDVFHLAWPERWSGVDPAVTARVIDQVRAADVRIAWTQHNLVPHRRNDEEGFATYALWAKAANLVIHHSEYGRKAALATHFYGPHTKHVVIPHGAWSDHYSACRAVGRSEVELEEGWPPAWLRLAVIGQPRREKDVQAVLDAIHASSRDDVQLVARVPPGVTAADPRVILEYGHLSDRRFRRRMMAFERGRLAFHHRGHARHRNGVRLHRGRGARHHVGLGIPSRRAGQRRHHIRVHGHGAHSVHRQPDG